MSSLFVASARDRKPPTNLGAILEESLSNVSSMAPIASKIPTPAQFAAATPARVQSKQEVKKSEPVPMDTDEDTKPALPPIAILHQPTRR